MNTNVPRILSIVVTYYPDNELLRRNIGAFINDVDKILIWENTPVAKKYQYRSIKDEKIEYCGNGINSISCALNYAWRYAREFGYNYLLTMDQDSQWENFHDYINQTINNPSVFGGIWGPEAYGNKPKEIIESERIITSGMLLSVELINRIGGWNETFSVDCVDDDFCLRAKIKGIKTYILGMCRLRQQYGTPRRVSFLGRHAMINYDSPKRLYSIYKSHVILIRLYPGNKNLKSEFRSHWISLIKWTVVFGNKPVNNLIAIIRGIFVGLFVSLKNIKK